jgi:hypothetical protein
MEVPMSVLDKLQIVGAIERSQTYDPVRVRRKKIAAALQEQANLLAAESGGAYQSVRVQRKRDLETDEVVEVEKRRRVTPWWSYDDAGQVRFSLRYGSVPLKVRDGDSVIVVATTEALKALIPSLRQEALKGGLDAPLEAAAGELMARFKRQPQEKKKA